VLRDDVVSGRLTSAISCTLAPQRRGRITGRCIEEYSESAGRAEIFFLRELIRPSFAHIRTGTRDGLPAGWATFFATVAANGETMTRRWLQDTDLPALVLILTVAALGIGGAHAQTYTDLHDFSTATLASPQFSGILAQGRNGDLYGTAPVGGTSGRGGVFRITPAGTYSAIYSFDGIVGANPYSGLTLGKDGNFYGTTFGGGTGGFGIVFRVTPAGIVTVLHNFVYTDGTGAYAPPIQGTDGNFYGTTSTGGISYGAVYKVTPAGVFTVLYTFDNTHGAAPIAPLIQATDGSFYGTTKVGGTNGYGTVFKITPTGALTVLYNFDLTHGAYVFSPLIQAVDGSFYGTTSSGGTLNGGGVAFKLTPARILTVIHNFDGTAGTQDGNRPYAGLVQVSDGSFYGLASAGGANAAGTLYHVTSTGGYSGSSSFTPATGSLPYATLRQHTNGRLYGEATSGGAAGHGALFSFDLGLEPFITLRPTAGVVGKSVDILGQGLSQSTSVRFTPNVAANASVFSDTYMTTVVPNAALTGTVTVLLTQGQVSSDKKFRVAPTVGTFSPTSGSVGTSVTITGNSLTGAAKVTFGGGKVAVFTVNSNAQITSTVPAGAVTGKIQVITPGGTATSPSAFTVN
jgi:uncharacterized repeat protein (TIGR03803 family)